MRALFLWLHLERNYGAPMQRTLALALLLAASLCRSEGELSRMDTR